ncbi:MAG: DUF3347 domain-containing protein [Pedobacter sp.]|nr:MAG: DUF3347 domain-containing protein [Pedobacter sp.]
MACNNAENKSTDLKDTTQRDTTVVVATPINFKDVKLQSIYGGYISLKNALVASNAADANTAAGKLAGELKVYSGCENTALIAQKIEKSDDLVLQRKEFTSLSNDVISLFKHAELTEGVIYLQHCPMANKGDGGDWLASEKKIQNPYYGSEMMECGAVLEEIKTK